MDMSLYVILMQNNYSIVKFRLQKARILNAHQIRPAWVHRVVLVVEYQMSVVTSYVFVST